MLTRAVFEPTSNTLELGGELRWYLGLDLRFGSKKAFGERMSCSRMSGVFFAMRISRLFFRLIWIASASDMLIGGGPVSSGCCGGGVCGGVCGVASCAAAPPSAAMKA